MHDPLVYDPARARRAGTTFHGRRKGRPLRTRQAGLMETLLPQHQITPTGPIPDLGSLWTTPTYADYWLEIGFGAGEHLALQARHHSDIGFIGAEPFQNGVARFLEEVAAHDLRNTRIYMEDVRHFLPLLPDAALGRVFILFPDPWPKKRHYKRRLIQHAFLDVLFSKMRPGAELHVASDHADYVAWIEAHLEARSELENRTQDRTRSPDLWVQTRYENKGLAAGRPGTFLMYVRRSSP